MKKFFFIIVLFSVVFSYANNFFAQEIRREYYSSFSKNVCCQQRIVEEEDEDTACRCCRKECECVKLSYCLCSNGSQYAEPYSNSYCKGHALALHGKVPGVPVELLELIPSVPACSGGKNAICIGCGGYYPSKQKEARPSIYMGYLEAYFHKYSHVKQQLEYFKRHQECKCFWPEYSAQAVAISNRAYLLFKDFFENTPMKLLLKNRKAQEAFIFSQVEEEDDDRPSLSKHGLVLSVIATQFRFSDYWHVCQEIENFAKLNFETNSFVLIQTKLYDILEAISEDFLQLYSNCYAIHPNEEIKQELVFMQLLGIGNEDKVTSKSLHDYALKRGASRKKISFTSKKHRLKSKGIASAQQKDIISEVSLRASKKNYLMNEIKPFSLKSAILLEKGTRYNELFLHADAIKILSEAIHFNPLNTEAYIERASAYLATNNFQNALDDYKMVKQLCEVDEVRPKSVSFKEQYMKPKALFLLSPSLNSGGFAQGLCKGILKGSANELAETLPMIWSSSKAICRGLWAFVADPKQTSKEMLETAYAMGEYLSKTDKSLLELAVPEVQQLSLNWTKLNDDSKGEEIGIIIGKYGVVIFGPSLIIKSVNKLNGMVKWRALNRANTISILERLSASGEAEATLLKECSKLAEAEEILLGLAKAGKIVIKSPNVMPHIMQSKHGWNKIITLSGDMEKDFKMVCALLEKHNICSKENFIRSRTFEEGKIIVREYQQKIMGHEVQAFFETYIETNETFLQNGWVLK